VSKRFANYGPGKTGAAQKDWNKGAKPNTTNDEEEEDRDPDWIDFDPEKNRDKFFGHVMPDEA
jgi:hypothetical protein